MHDRLRSPRRAGSFALVAGLLLLARSGVAAPAQFVPADDPIVAELRLLDLFATRDSSLRLPHANSLPFQVQELTMGGAAPEAAGAVLRVSYRRLSRTLSRDASTPFAGPSSTPRLFTANSGDERFELSTGLEGAHESVRREGVNDSRWTDGSGVHVRTGIQVDRWFAYSHLFFGELRGVRAFSDAIVANSDLAASTEESYLAYSAGTRWSAQLGRSRWQWGPGEEASLLLSRTSAPITGLMLHARLEALRADAFVFNATVEPGLGEQLAAHRLEWQPRSAVRLGVSEAARYHAGGWQGVYLAGVIPYALAQRLLDQDHRDSTGALRNNVMVSLDASVRVADGSRAYGELLIDDLHARSAAFPNKYGWQLGWDGAGEVLTRRVTWNVEYTRLSRYVYTSYFGRTYEAQDRPLGFPTGPDARRLRLRVTCDPGADWQFSAIAAQTDKGGNDLDEPFVPGDPVPDVGVLEGVPTRIREFSGVARWWPASGVDLAVRVGRTLRENAGDILGTHDAAWSAGLAFRLTR